MKISRIAIATGMCGIAGAAFAGPNVSVKYLGTGAGQTVTMTLNGNSTNVFAGQLKHNLSNAQGGYGWINGDHLTYCTDLTQYVTSSTKTYTIENIENMPGNSPMGVTKADAIRGLFAAANGAQAAANASADYATAFQLAVWEIVTDGAGASITASSFTSGNFKAKKTNGNALSGNVVSIAANLYSSAVLFVQAHSSTDQIIGVASNSYQDQLIQVPTPGAAALAGIGGLLIAGRRRRSV